MIRREQGFVAMHLVSFRDEQLLDLAADLRADDDVVGGDDAGQHERGGGAAQIEVGAGSRGNDDEEQQANRGS